MKKALAILALISIFSLTAFAENLSDINANKNQTAIEYLYSKNVISGYPDGTFKPENTVNRAELMKILVAGKGIQPTVEEYNNCFPDVTNEWFAPFVCYAKKQGWVGGYPDGTFQASKDVNKAEAIKMLVNAEGFALPQKFDEYVFNDVTSTNWFAPFILVAKQKGLLEETEGNYYPSGVMKRAEISENIYRAIIINENGLQTFPVNKNYLFYVSSQARTKYYCETDSSWENLSKANLLQYSSEAELRADFPNLTLNQPC